MLLLTSINDKLQIITGSAGDVRCHFSYVDNNAGTITPDRKNTSISTSTTTDVVLAPTASTQRNIKSGIIYNAHATVANLVTVQHTDGTTIVVLEKVTLQPGEFIEFEENGGWTYENSSGIPFAAGLGGPVDVQTFAYPGGTWTKPTTFTSKVVFVKLWGAGGGGGAGASLATAVIAKGGAGGGGGAFIRETYLASDLPSTVTVTVGQGGAAGAPGAAGARRQTPGFENAHGPEPLVEAHAPRALGRVLSRRQRL